VLFVTGYLCPLSANTYGIEFLEFRIREMEGLKRELYNVKKPDDAVDDENVLPRMHPSSWNWHDVYLLLCCNRDSFSADLLLNEYGYIIYAATDFSLRSRFWTYLPSLKISTDLSNTLFPRKFLRSI
jgi:hypothetical protein